MFSRIKKYVHDRIAAEVNIRIEAFLDDKLRELDGKIANEIRVKLRAKEALDSAIRQRLDNIDIEHLVETRVEDMDLSGYIDYSRIAGCIDSEELAEHIDVESLVESKVNSIDISNHIDLSELAGNIDLSDLAGYIDADDIAGNIDAEEIAKYVEVDAGEIADRLTDRLRFSVVRD